ncbi:MAG: protein kinase [Actinomycetota bacterium]|nr:protein kinase [Actinomycetota bacterium]
MSDALPLEGAAGVHTERVLAGRYRLKHLIANGGMAEVWEAVDDILGRPVAVKILHSHLAEDESFRERFRREAIAAARLAHPGVVATFDTGVDGAITFIVMELVNGQTLRQALNETGPMAPGRVVHIGAQAADALDYAHRAGVVHRDIKPANILLCPDGRLKVADFGIAKAVEESEPSRPDPAEALTGTGSIVGTAQYLSPEQVEGRAVDGRTDVYSLGVVLYEMLCGRPPFTGETEMAVALQHVTTDAPALRQVRPGVPPALEAVVLRAMAKSPGARYQSAADLQTALLSVDLGAQEATNVVARPQYVPPANDVGAVTPPHGIPPTFAPRKRRWLVPAVAIIAVALTVAVVAVIFARSDAGHRVLGSTGTPAQSAAKGPAIPRPTPSAFDPAGDGQEHDSDLGLLVDGDPATAWSTEQYSSRLSQLKPGVGVAFQLDSSYKLGHMRVTSATQGWSAQVFVADAPKSTIQAWGQPVATNNDVGGGDTTFDLGGRSGAAVLLWITDLGNANSSVSIGEVSITSS